MVTNPIMIPALSSRITSLIVPGRSRVDGGVPTGGVIKGPGGLSPASDILQLEKHFQYYYYYKTRLLFIYSKCFIIFLLFL